MKNFLLLFLLFVAPCIAFAAPVKQKSMARGVKFFPLAKEQRVIPLGRATAITETPRAKAPVTSTVGLSREAAQQLLSLYAEAH